MNRLLRAFMILELILARLKKCFGKDQRQQSAKLNLNGNRQGREVEPKSWRTKRISRTEEERRKLAHSAFELDNNNADVLLLQAEIELNHEQAIELYEQAIKNASRTFEPGENPWQNIQSTVYAGCIRLRGRFVYIWRLRRSSIVVFNY